ncbi:protein SODIUM POTASSIUM ROOT DEFECTIVE 2-like [Zingiber officinale]|uniref:HMA domain-containing protein n=1 Tax=Zingiber officinale TaxID=94328 RepID=A0A8J5FFT9_ZINOF|nr:protein SODIUM POTASSIUM ROOT DEFECTIVE 2-like [Zingiber officinale]KAG6484688.1 hypothetical protein ZIOFF_053210 [Zingiber officinale]
MGRSSLVKVFNCFSLMISANTCICSNTLEEEEEAERRALLQSEVLKFKDAFDGAKTLAFHLEPKTVVLRVSMHCSGCARKVHRHISKMEGVSSIEMDLESKKVVVVGDVTPFEVLESVSKVKFAELWLSPPPHAF